MNWYVQVDCKSSSTFASALVCLWFDSLSCGQKRLMSQKCISPHSLCFFTRSAQLERSNLARAPSSSLRAEIDRVWTARCPSFEIILLHVLREIGRIMCWCGYAYHSLVPRQVFADAKDLERACSSKQKAANSRDAWILDLNCGSFRCSLIGRCEGSFNGNEPVCLRTSIRPRGEIVHLACHLPSFAQSILKTGNIPENNIYFYEGFP